MKTRPEAFLVGSIVSSWEHRQLFVNREYQRGLTWSEAQQQLLADSILRGYPLPRFYLRETRSKGLGGEMRSYEVIDGQQRIAAMVKCLGDAWRLPDPKNDRVRLPKAVAAQPCPWADKLFSELPDHLQEQIRNTELSVLVVEDASDDEVRDLFIRLQAGTALTRQQVRDAWPGNVGPYVERLAGKQHTPTMRLFGMADNRGNRVGTEDDMRDPYHNHRQTCAQLLCLFMERRKSGQIRGVGAAALDDLYHEYTDFDGKSVDAQRFENLIRYCEKVIDSRPRDGRNVKTVPKIRFFTLFLTLERLDAGGRVSIDRELAKIAQVFWRSTTDASEPPSNKAVAGKSIQEHYLWFVRTQLPNIQIEGLDQQRLFDAKQKDQIRSRDQGACAVCGKAVDRSDEEFDHKTMWIDGGATSPENGRLVHRACHPRGRPSQVGNL